MSELTVFASESEPNTIAIHTLRAKDFDTWFESQPERTRRWIQSTQFKAKPNKTCLIPSADGGVELVVMGIGDEPSLWDFATAAKTLPSNTYRLDSELTDREATHMALGWGLVGYRFNLYRKKKTTSPRFILPKNVDAARIRSTLEAVFLVRDLITTPASDMGPAQLEAAAKSLADSHGAAFRSIVGNELIEQNYPSIHAVGRAAAADRAPRLIDFTWGDESHPRVSLVGKGVCFDSGGLDLKPARAMKLMKKDMGGAAHVLGLAKMIMDAGLPVRLRVLIPAVENSVSASALRPMDVIRTRSGITIEIGHTDAEGRVILCDALSEASTEKPEVLFDFATLTGAARVALGTELPALFCNNDALAETILSHASSENDPLWRLPLWQPYRSHIEGKSADITNSADVPQGGAITAALFLAEFVDTATPWVHIDLMAWNSRSRPGRPEGGEAMGLRAVFAALEKRFS